MRLGIPAGLYCYSEPDSYAVVEENCTGGLVTDKVGADVVLLNGYPQSCMQNPVEGLLEVYEDMVKVLLVLKILLTKDFLVEDLLCGVPPCSEASLPVLQR